MNIQFNEELKTLLNRHSIDNECQTPDFILADAVSGFLCNLRDTVKRRENWHGRQPELQQDLFTQETPKAAGVGQ